MADRYSMDGWGSCSRNGMCLYTRRPGAAFNVAVCSTGVRWWSFIFVSALAPVRGHGINKRAVRRRDYGTGRREKPSPKTNVRLCQSTSELGPIAIIGWRDGSCDLFYSAHSD